MSGAGDAASRLTRYAAEAAARPDDPDRQMFHGNALLEAGQPEAAVERYRAAMALRPGHAPTLYNLGNALLALDDPEAAEAMYAEAAALAPGHAGTHNNRGNALRRLGRLEEAEASYREAVALRGDFAGTHNNLASTLLALHRPEEAVASLETALRLQPDYAEACNNMGGASLALDRPEAALHWFRRAVDLDETQVQARFGCAMALLVMGRLREGFRAYESRWLDPRFRDDGRTYEAPLWLGQTDPAGLTVLLHAEQGLGDTIQFIRYAPLLRARGARVVVEAQAPLLGLLAPLADAVVAAGDTLPAHDLRTPLLSLPHAFGTVRATIPAAIPYLRAPPPRVDVRGPGLNVAFAFAGSADHPEDALRSLPPHLPAAFAPLPGVTAHLIRRDPGPHDGPVPPGWRLHCGELRDFTDTAATLAAMDLVVSVDTAVAHLAGALGLPVWIMLQRAADFRWLRGRDDSTWYPTARLFRQGSDRRWEQVVEAVTAALRREATGEHRYLRHRPQR